MDEGEFRKQSLDRIASPEQLSDYLHVTNPTVWLILTAVIVLLIGALVWGATASIDSTVTGTAQVEGGQMKIVFESPHAAENVQPGMTVKVGEHESRIVSVGTGEDGVFFAVAESTLENGAYSATVTYRQTKVLQLLFN